MVHPFGWFSALRQISAQARWRNPTRPPRTPTRALDRRHRVHHLLQQQRVVGVGGRQADRQRDAAPIGEQVVLGARLAAVCRVRAGQAAPRLARTLNESRLARDQSSWPWRPSWSSSAWWSCCHTPARCQSRGRRSGVVAWGAGAGWPATTCRERGRRWWSWPRIMPMSSASSKNRPKVGSTLLGRVAGGGRFPPATRPKRAFRGLVR